MNRRNLLKVFGTGAVIAPVVGGEVLAEPLARIITPPEVKILEGKTELLKPAVDRPLSMTDIQSVDMTLNYKDGTRRVIHGVANDDTDMIDRLTPMPPWLKYWTGTWNWR